MCDEIYDQIVYDDAEFIRSRRSARTRRRTFGGLSKVSRLQLPRRLGVVQRRGRPFGALHERARSAAALRLCGNVPGQWAVQTALGGRASVSSARRAAGYTSRARP
jgi:alanine-synthesizing transaminase